MIRKCLTVCAALALIPFLLPGQVGDNDVDSLINAIDRIGREPRFISAQSTLKVNSRGGHLQGIQYVNFRDKGYYILTGSSDSYSYYAVVKSGDEPSVISINKILDKPLKHAGGFQIYKDLMAVGVEDNDKRDKSKVYIYRMEDPEKPPAEPIAVIERSGPYQRATAGCTGIIGMKGRILVVVGDWDTRHLDFYAIGTRELAAGDGKFELKYSIGTREADRSGWVDRQWYSYQNINMLKDGSGRLYIAGMASKGEGRNVIDLYRVETKDLAAFRLTKIYSKTLKWEVYAGFNWGAGVYISDEHELKVISCGGHIQKRFEIGVYE